MLRQAIGQNGESQAQGGEEHFAERLDIDNAPAVIVALERGQWRAMEPKFAVIVILDDNGVGFLCPSEKFKATRQ